MPSSIFRGFKINIIIGRQTLFVKEKCVTTGFIQYIDVLDCQPSVDIGSKTRQKSVKTTQEAGLYRSQTRNPRRNYSTATSPPTHNARMLSSPSSFHTALDFPSSPSPSSMADSTDERGNSLENPQYCQANKISREIEDHVKIYFDERMCMDSYFDYIGC